MEANSSLLHKKIIQLLPWAALLCFVLIINSFSYNFPQADDYTAIIRPLFEYQDTRSVNFLFEVHSQHFQVLLRLISLLMLNVLGEINFRPLIFLGSLFVFPVIYFLKKDTLKSPLEILAVCLIFAQPLYCEAILWATASLQTTWGIALSLGAIYFASSRRAFFSIAFLSMSLLTWGGSFATVPIVFLIGFFQKRFALCMWPILFGSFFIFANSGIDAASFDDIPRILLTTMQVIGSGIFFNNGALSLYTGIGITAALLIHTFASYKKLSTADYYGLYFLLCCLLHGIGRHTGLDYLSYSTSRYTLLTCCLLAVIAINILKRGWVHVALIASLLFSVHHWWAFFPMLTQRQEELIQANIRWDVFQNGLINPLGELANQIHSSAEERGIISSEPITIQYQNQVPCWNILPKENFVYGRILKVEQIFYDGDVLYLSGYAVRPKERPWRGKYQLQINDTLCFNLNTATRPDVDILLARKKSLPRALRIESGFNGIVMPPENVAPKKLSLLIKNRDKVLKTDLKWNEFSL